MEKNGDLTDYTGPSQWFEFTEYDERGDEITRSTLEVTDPGPHDLSGFEQEFVSSKSLIPDNTTSWGPVFHCRPNHGSYRRWWISLAWIREAEEPWRRGYGIAVGPRRHRHVVGGWVAGEPIEGLGSDAVSTPEVIDV